VEYQTKLVQSDVVCDYGMNYYSVIGEGKAQLIWNIREKQRALQKITEKYSGKVVEFSKEDVASLEIITVEITDVSGRKSGY